MPQLDKVIFAPIAFWTFVIYVGSFLFTSSGVMYTLLSAVNSDLKRFGATVVHSPLQSQCQFGGSNVYCDATTNRFLLALPIVLLVTRKPEETGSFVTILCCMIPSFLLIMTLILTFARTSLYGPYGSVPTVSTLLPPERGYDDAHIYIEHYEVLRALHARKIIKFHYWPVCGEPTTWFQKALTAIWQECCWEQCVNESDRLQFWDWFLRRMPLYCFIFLTLSYAAATFYLQTALQVLIFFPFSCAIALGVYVLIREVIFIKKVYNCIRILDGYALWYPKDIPFTELLRFRDPDRARRGVRSRY